MKKFGKKGKDRARKEAKQLSDRTVWNPVHPNDLTMCEKKKAIKSLIFLSENRDSTVKGRTSANGSTQRSHTPIKKASIPTVTTKSVLMTRVIDAK